MIAGRLAPGLLESMESMEMEFLASVENLRRLVKLYIVDGKQVLCRVGLVLCPHSVQ
jgi:hypothetical protein